MGIKTIGFFVLCIFSVWEGQLTLAQDMAPAIPPKQGESPIEIIRGDVDYDFDHMILTVTPGTDDAATLNYKQKSITANHLTYDVNTEILDATGHVRLWDQGAILQGERLKFNFRIQSATLYKVKNSEIADGVFFAGEKLTYYELPADKVKHGTQEREFTLFDGTVTTNDKPFPYYHVEYDKLRIQPNTRFWVYNMLFVANNIPMFYFPFFSQSLAESRLTYYFEIGHYNNLGTIAFNRINYKVSDEYQVDLFGDYSTKIGIGKGARFRFDVEGDYSPKGYLYGYHLDQEAPDNDYIFDGDDRYHISGQYEQNLPYDMRFTARGHKLSDSEYRWDFRHPEKIRESDVRQSEVDSVSFFNLSKRWEDQSARITYASRFDPFYYNGLPYVEREPQIHFEQYPMQLFNSGFYADARLDYGRYRREEGNTFPLNETTLFDRTNYVDEVDRYDAELRFAYPYSIPSWVFMKPWVGIRGTHYQDPSRWVDDPTLPGYQLQGYSFDSETRAMLEGGLELSTRRTYEFDPFLNRYQRMRTVLEPVIEYSYFHPDNSLEDITAGPGIRFPYIDPTDEIRFKMHRVSALLKSRIQGKNAAGISSDFAYFAAGVSYDQITEDNLRFDNFEFFDDPANHDDYRFSDLIEEFSIYPTTWLSLGNNLRYDVDDGVIRSAYYYSNINPVERLQLSLGYYTYRYPFIDVEEQQDATFRLMFDVSKKWQLYYASRFDLDQSTFRVNRIGLMRDMYDFFALFEIEHEEHPTLGEDLSFNFSIQFWGIGGRQGRDAPLRF